MMRTPLATYRIQFNPEFDFAAARKVIPYLSDLGISDLYASPVFKARKGSPHGYDVVDPARLNPELGGESLFEALIGELKAFHMGWLQDIVTNHMAFDADNPMLMDVLENGESSEFFAHFDVNWNHLYPSLRGRILAPLLGKFYGDALEQGEIRIGYDANGFYIRYFDLVFPLKIETYVHLLTHRLATLRPVLGNEHPDLAKLFGILYVLRVLPSRNDAGERSDQITFIKKTLWEMYSTNPAIRKYIDDNLQIFNGTTGKPETFTLLDHLLSQQLFRLSFWKVATEEINYRRFFNINEFLGVRVQDEAAFDRMHALIFGLADAGLITGLRIDHIDGLYDPKQYLTRLRARLLDLYIVVEKILEPREELPLSWPVQGTTGYDFLNCVNGIFCRKEHGKKFDQIYSDFIRSRIVFKDMLPDKKRLIMGKHMAGDIDNLAHLLKEVSSTDRSGNDITLYGLKRALVEVMAHFPVYRTYLSGGETSETASGFIRSAVELAERSNPGLLHELQFIRKFLLLEFRTYLTEEEKYRWTDFVMRFQQLTGPLMAKGFEDTALYIYNRLLSLNEVGGNPEIFGVSLDEFHRFNQSRCCDWPRTLNATSTHDAKRGEDMRARLDVLSEMPQEWEERLKAWSKVNTKHKRKVQNLRAPDRNDEYFLYQTLVGAFPFTEGEFPEMKERIRRYAVKAVREAKVHTAWLKPDKDYEDACLFFIEKILDPSSQNAFLPQFRPFQKKVAFYGIFNSLSQTLIKITTPGVPDFYQGTELWDLNLVDPDNRRPVDFQKRESLLDGIRAGAAKDLAALLRDLLLHRQDGRIKLWLVFMGLRARKDYSEVFQSGKYVPLAVSGRYSDRIVAFGRNAGDKWMITLAPRFLVTLVKEGEDPLGTAVWRDTTILLEKGFPRLWSNVLTGEVIEVRDSLVIGEVLLSFPVALLVNKV